MSNNMCARLSLIDIAVNLTDAMFSGMYNGKQYHKADIESVLQRAVKTGVRSIIITAGSLHESISSIDMCREFNTSIPGLQCFCTVGCHPTRCDEIENYVELDSSQCIDGLRAQNSLHSSDDHTCVQSHDDLTTRQEHARCYMNRLEKLILEHSVQTSVTSDVTNKCVVALGECGLDYDRLTFCSKEVQQCCFIRQLELAARCRLPVFLHNRNTDGDFVEIMSRFRGQLVGGVVHSFTGTLSELHSCLDLNLYIGINGCSLKTAENISIAAQVPLSRSMIETDAPWCEIRNTHASRALLNAAASRDVRGRSDATKSEKSQSLTDVILAEYSTQPKNKHNNNSFVKGRTEPSHLIQILEVLYELHRDKIDSIETLADIITTNVQQLFPFCKN